MIIPEAKREWIPLGENFRKYNLISRFIYVYPHQKFLIIIKKWNVIQTCKEIHDDTCWKVIHILNRITQKDLNKWETSLKPYIKCKGISSWINEHCLCPENLMKFRKLTLAFLSLFWSIKYWMIFFYHSTVNCFRH